jgi:hypothetical protein
MDSAGRMGTAQGNRPGTGSRAVPMTARPLTQQGMSGMQEGKMGSRQIHDGQYFYSKLSEKRSQILDVNEKLKADIEKLESQRSTTVELMDRLQELTSEVKEMEFQMQHYNLVVQKGTVSTSAVGVQQEIAALQVQPHPSMLPDK